jgi:hypothetical protein
MYELKDPHHKCQVGGAGDKKGVFPSGLIKQGIIARVRNKKYFIYLYPTKS